MKGHYFKLCISLLVLGAFVFAADVLMPFVKRVPDLITFADEVIRPIALFIATGIAIYLGNLKLRKPNIECVASVSSELGYFRPPFLSKISLANQNDINIFIYDVFVKLPGYDPVLIERFEEPKVLKALDSIKIELLPVSSYHKIPDEVIEDIFVSEAKIMLGTNKGLVESNWREYQAPEHIVPLRNSIDDKVYGKATRYFMYFKTPQMNKVNAALIDKRGMIDDSIPYIRVIKWNENWKKELEDICRENNIEYCEIGMHGKKSVFTYQQRK